MFFENEDDIPPGSFCSVIGILLMAFGGAGLLALGAIFLSH